MWNIITVEIKQLFSHFTGLTELQKLYTPLHIIYHYKDLLKGNKWMLENLF